MSAAILSAVLGPFAAAQAQAQSAASPYPITPAQRSTAQQVAKAGVPLSELVPNAPDSYTVKRGDTLWGISGMFLKSPWRWPALWGMNLDEIRNPHLIYPGQLLVLEKDGAMARLRMGNALGGSGQSTGTVRLSPRIRSDAVGNGAIASIPLNLIEPFLNEAIVFNTNELETAPRIVASQEGRVLLSRGDVAYVRGDLGSVREYRIFRQPKPLLDPTTKEVLGFEASYVGTAEYLRQGGEKTSEEGKLEVVPATFAVTTIRQEASVGDRLAPLPPQDFSAYAPHAPANDIAGRIVSIYGEALTAGQNQIVALNAGARDGLERGHVLALIRNGRETVDSTDPAKPMMKLPDERHGTLFVFRVFDRVSYALILSVSEPVRPGDRFSQP
ncbi:MAG: peptidoglycan-binding protein [Rhizobacter sp.]|nr:peptidoglycan-binding protein [Rhizobacter sp.]